MAGPGGGPPRKSHTKSRKGCKTCKKRHIRCDEMFPQCRNCTKHNCRCDYMDMPAAGEDHLKGSQPPDLLMSPELQRRLDNWRITGDSFLPELQMVDRLYWTRFSTIDLRLIHHMVTLSTDMYRRGYSNCTVWGLKMDSLITVALSHDFTMNALLALSASHLASQTRNADTVNLAYHHRGVSLKGLHEAIGAFSRENSEAILAASIMLSWQSTEWRGWASLQQGVSTVLSAMRQWLHESDLARYLESQRAVARITTSAKSTLPYSQGGIAHEELRHLEQITTAVHILRLRLPDSGGLTEHAGLLLEFLQGLQQDLHLQGPQKAFERLQPLRDLIFWLPPQILRSAESDLAPLTLLSHLYATALATDSVFPEIGGAYLGSMSVDPLENVHDLLRTRKAAQPHDTGAQVAVSLIEVPAQILASYRQRQRHNSHSGPNAGLYQYSPRSPFGAPPLTLSSSRGDTATPRRYTNSPIPGPSSGQSVPSSAYFQAALGPSNPTDLPREAPFPTIGRSSSWSERKVGLRNPQSTGMGVMNGPDTPQHPRSSHEISGTKADYFTQSQAPYSQYGSMDMNPRFVTLSQLSV
ncbi:hypothetical protein HRR86_002051 [Exophiala dermatitidis]|uniref:Zn(2)-C6 fungal-type domain-containing protein n=2 Tax=Exophiala dermatitidis TaxID=5970 RepID=H6BTG5_EXODN|nr:uncharacterized protein HMPREF1120_02532 [Exophiala dermatitidis NIH/UT8656]KAJ4535738.1 hypothetical protein HRR77_007685 [Exophiala dermatitidis]EHY54362.1 hypothetical protein HMPREF1120_02532 [Exophiala dermatitidis NIH/UT8656]KAJ4541847.1 hypothetical protein HRR78_007125 [Exophiala dermatitidis]KAJ4570062.1 hypothetical protein HRR82_007628 [Exophiala dermatitidis]KAJ4632919.1 hypothetical protein HRR86_002051 [Exophiala dermatitidis]